MKVGTAHEQGMATDVLDARSDAEHRWAMELLTDVCGSGRRARDVVASVRATRGEVTR